MGPPRGPDRDADVAEGPVSHPRSWAERLGRLDRWTEIDRRGHVLEWEEPELVADDLRALCFGWIGSRPNALDAERYRQCFPSRKPKSPWSKINKERIARLIDTGQMTPAGLAKIEAAKADGSWSAYDAIESLTTPADLATALRANPAAHTGFHAFSASTKEQLLW